MTTPKDMNSMDAEALERQPRRIMLRLPLLREFRDDAKPFRIREMTDGKTNRIEFEYEREAFDQFLMRIASLSATQIAALTDEEYNMLRREGTSLFLSMTGTEMEAYIKPPQSRID